MSEHPTPISELDSNILKIGCQMFFGVKMILTHEQATLKRLVTHHPGKIVPNIRRQ
jgi:hypothetical protein